MMSSEFQQAVQQGMPPPTKQGCDATVPRRIGCQRPLSRDNRRTCLGDAVNQKLFEGIGDDNRIFFDILILAVLHAEHLRALDLYTAKTSSWSTKRKRGGEQTHGQANPHKTKKVIIRKSRKCAQQMLPIGVSKNANYL